MSASNMLYVAFVLGPCLVVASVFVARLRHRNDALALLALLFRFSCLLVGVAATAYGSAAPGGPHPISAYASGFLLFAYVVSGDPLISGISRSRQNGG